MEIIGILFIATFVEGFVEYLFSPITKIKPFLGYIALIFGVFLAIIYQINLLDMVGITTNYTIVSYVISGVIIGRGSNFVNDIISKFKK